DCDNVGPLNDEMVCARCQNIAERVRQRIEQGRLPRISLREAKGPRTTARQSHVTGIPCVACDDPINSEHWAYPDYPDPRARRHLDLHFHVLCHAIWEEEATITD